MNFEPLDWLKQELSRLEGEQMRRDLRERRGAQAGTVELEGESQLSFAANDYLGLAADARLVEAASACANVSGWGSGASPSVTGHTAAQAELETQLSEFEGTEAALVFSSGFAANTGVVTSLSTAGDTVFSDAKNHASLIDGCRLSRGRTRVYRHADVDHLRTLLSETRNESTRGRRLIVTDGLFSMDGDLAPLPELAALAEEFEAILIVDEAHATGVLGASGRGSCEYWGVEERVPVRIGTLSKALGSVGGFVTGQRELIDWLVNRARSFIFSTALPAACHAASMAALRIVQAEPQRRERLRQMAAYVRAELAARGWQQLGDTGPIVPIRVGTPSAALEASSLLQKERIFIPAIRPPSVPVGESLLRISLNANHTDDEIERLVQALSKLPVPNGQA